MAFWIITTGLAAVCAVFMAVPVLWQRQAGSGERRDIGVYRAQLKAVERDVTRGTVAAGEADRLRTEIKRRILEADRLGGPVAGAAPRQLSRVTAALCAVTVIGGSLVMYRSLGAQGYRDLPLKARIEMADAAAAERPGQAEAEAQVPPGIQPEAAPEYASLMERLRAAVAARPDDLEGHRLLVRNEAGLGNFAAAHAAQARVLEILGEEATAKDFADHADLLILAAGGYVSPEAERALTDALNRDPRNGTARYYLGLMRAQTGRPDLAFRVWEALLRESRPKAPWVPLIRAQIEEAAFRAGVDYKLAPESGGPAGGGPVTGGVGGSPGPTEADVAAAVEMSPADRMAMIEGMVQGLSDRLAEQGGPPEDWARLIRAYGVLGRRDAAGAIWAEAQTLFDETAIIPVLQAARDAGVAQ